jgi:hypothetical protein
MGTLVQAPNPSTAGRGCFQNTTRVFDHTEKIEVFKGETGLESSSRRFDGTLRREISPGNTEPFRRFCCLLS